MPQRPDWRIAPPQFATLVTRVGKFGETIRVPTPSKGRALNLARLLRVYCKALRDAQAGEVGELRDWAPLVSTRIDPADGTTVIVQPQAESVNAKLVASALEAAKASD